MTGIALQAAGMPAFFHSGEVEAILQRVQDTDTNKDIVADIVADTGDSFISILTIMVIKTKRPSLMAWESVSFAFHFNFPSNLKIILIIRELSVIGATDS